MAGYFDPVDHEEFSRYIVANQRHFDEIEAQHLASKTAGSKAGNVLYLFVPSIIISSYLFVVVSGGTKPKGDVGGGSTEKSPMEVSPDVNGHGCAEYTAVGSGRPQRNVASKFAKK